MVIDTVGSGMGTDMDTLMGKRHGSGHGYRYRHRHRLRIEVRLRGLEPPKTCGGGWKGLNGPILYFSASITGLQGAPTCLMLKTAPSQSAHFWT